MFRQRVHSRGLFERRIGHGHKLATRNAVKAKRQVGTPLGAISGSAYAAHDGVGHDVEEFWGRVVGVKGSATAPLHHLLNSRLVHDRVGDT